MEVWADEVEKDEVLDEEVSLMGSQYTEEGSSNVLVRKLPSKVSLSEGVEDVFDMLQ